MTHYERLKQAQKEAKGLGDTIAAVTEATGIDTLVKTVEQITGKKCNCSGRRAWLNKRFPY